MPFSFYVQNKHYAKIKSYEIIKLPQKQDAKSAM